MMSKNVILGYFEMVSSFASVDHKTLANLTLTLTLTIMEMSASCCL